MTETSKTIRAHSCRANWLARAGAFVILGIAVVSSPASASFVGHPRETHSPSSTHTNNVIRVIRYVYRNSQGQAAYSTIAWDFKGAIRSEDFSADGVLNKEEFGTYAAKQSVTDAAGRYLVGKGIDFVNHTWDPNPFFGLPPVSISQLEATDRSGIANKQYRVIGYPLLHGVQTIEFSCPTSACGAKNLPTPLTEWVNRSTYQPLQNIQSAGDGLGYTETFSYLVPTQTNLKQLTAAVPPGFKNCTAPPEDASMLAECVIAF